MLRQSLRDARRVVIKVGSRVLVEDDGRPNEGRIRSLVAGIVRLRAQNREVVLVSSGAIGTGLHVLGLKTRPTDLPSLQMAAAVGQLRLMAIYDNYFSGQGCTIGQVLLTHADLKDRSRHLNTRNSMRELLRRGIVPIVNENDVVAVDEIKFGDNDQLAALVALLLQADALILLTTVDGFLMPDASERLQRVRYLRQVSAETLEYALGKGGPLSTGGMDSKLKSAGMAARMGIRVVIANGLKENTVEHVLAGEDIGTLICGGRAEKSRDLSGRKRWIAFFNRPQGALVVDAGAQAALAAQGRSLLPIGIRAVEGRFPAGALVDIRLAGTAPFARGLTAYASDDIERIKGCKSVEIRQRLGTCAYAEVIHRDNMVILD